MKTLKSINFQCFFSFTLLSKVLKFSLILVLNRVKYHVLNNLSIFIAYHNEEMKDCAIRGKNKVRTVSFYNDWFVSYTSSYDWLNLFNKCQLCNST